MTTARFWNNLHRVCSKSTDWENQIIKKSHWREQHTFNEMMIVSALFKISTLNLIFIVLTHRNNGPQKHMSLNSELLLLIEETPNTIFIVFGSNKTNRIAKNRLRSPMPERGEPTFYYNVHVYYFSFL